MFEYQIEKTLHTQNGAYPRDESRGNKSLPHSYLVEDRDWSCTIKGGRLVNINCKNQGNPNLEWKILILRIYTFWSYCTKFNDWCKDFDDGRFSHGSRNNMRNCDGFIPDICRFWSKTKTISTTNDIFLECASLSWFRSLRKIQTDMP